MNPNTLDMVQRGGFLLLLFVAVVTIAIVGMGWFERRRATRVRLERGASTFVAPGESGEIASLPQAADPQVQTWLKSVDARTAAFAAVQKFSAEALAAFGKSGQ